MTNVSRWGHDGWRGMTTGGTTMHREGGYDMWGGKHDMSRGEYDTMWGEGNMMHPEDIQHVERRI